MHQSLGARSFGGFFGVRGIFWKREWGYLGILSDVSKISDASNIDEMMYY